jgi:hypothetical protein
VPASFMRRSFDPKSGRLGGGLSTAVVDDANVDDRLGAVDELGVVAPLEIDTEAMEESIEERDVGVSIVLLALLPAALLTLPVKLPTVLLILPVSPKLFAQTSEMVTIFTPTPSLLLAGINSVVLPSFLFRLVRLG